MSTATAPRLHKRKFQPSMTSYFAHTDRDNFKPPTDHPPFATPTPSLPIAIQSSLLNVGMRVRKSVPEGYKTAPKTALLLLSRPRSAPPAAPPQSRCGVAELTPYCGIMKTGGLDSQPAPAEEDLPPLHLDNGEDGFPSSQESIASTIEVVSTSAQTSHLAHPLSYHTNKRRCDALDREDDSPDSGLGDDHFGLGLQAFSPRSHPVSHTRMPNLDSIRPICIPKTRKKWDVPPQMGRGEEDALAGIGDFEEAEFLQPGGWGTAEVEMGVCERIEYTGRLVLRCVKIPQVVPCHRGGSSASLPV